MKHILSFILLLSLTNCGQYRQCNPTIDNWDIIKPRCQEILRLYEMGELELRLEFGRGHYHIPDSLLPRQDYSDILAVTLGTRTEIFDGTYIAYFEGNGIEIIYTNNDQHQDNFERSCIRKLDQNWYLRKK